MFYPFYRQCPPNTIAYIIKPGDTFYRLAQQFKTTISAIISANPMIDPNMLRVGQRVCIPLQPIYPACPEGNYYPVKPGDTLYAIAGFYNVSLDDLIEANPGIDPYRLFVGQIICIPLATPPVTCLEGQGDYAVQAGDTFYTIAQKFNISLQELINANPGVNPNALLIGQIICIPD